MVKLTKELVANLKNRHYIKTSNNDNYWFNISVNPLLKYVKTFKDDFCIIVRRTELNSGYYVFPYSFIKEILTDDNKEDDGSRWIGTISKDILRIKKSQLNVAKYWKLDVENFLNMVPPSGISYFPLLLKKKQIIAYGPPGTGKTYSSKEIAVSLIQETNIFNSLLAKKSPINTIPTTLNEESFFEKIGKVSVKDQKTAKTIFDWTKEKGFLIRYTNKAANFDYLYGNQEYKLFKMFVDSPEDTFGVMELCFEHLINTPTFHDYSRRLELLKRFNEVSAFSLEEDDINKRPGLQRNIAIWNLDDETELNKFFSAIDWFLQVVKEET